jgi:hypothetical protein
VSLVSGRLARRRGDVKVCVCEKKKRRQRQSTKTKSEERRKKSEIESSTKKTRQRGSSIHVGRASRRRRFVGAEGLPGVGWQRYPGRSGVYV